MSFQLLDVWLNDTELVDTVTYYEERVVNSRLHFGTHGVLNLCIRALSAHLALHLLSGKHFSQTVSGSILLVTLDKEAYEVLLACFLFLLGFLHRLGESSISLVVSKHGDNVGHRYLKNHVHTALKVKTQADLHLAALLV